MDPQVSPDQQFLTQWHRLFGVIVLREMAKQPHNAFWHLFSAAEDQVQYGAENFKLNISDASTILAQLVKQYTLEGLTMPYTVEQFNQEVKEQYKKEIKEEMKGEIIKELTAEDLKRKIIELPAADLTGILKELPAENLFGSLKGLPADSRNQILKDLEESS